MGDERPVPPVSCRGILAVDSRRRRFLSYGLLGIASFLDGHLCDHVDKKPPLQHTLLDLCVTFIVSFRFLALFVCVLKSSRLTSRFHMPPICSPEVCRILSAVTRYLCIISFIFYRYLQCRRLFPFTSEFIFYTRAHFSSRPSSAPFPRHRSLYHSTHFIGLPVPEVASFILIHWVLSALRHYCMMSELSCRSTRLVR